MCSPKVVCSTRVVTNKPIFLPALPDLPDTWLTQVKKNRMEAATQSTLPQTIWKIIGAVLVLVVANKVRTTKSIHSKLSDYEILVSSDRSRDPSTCTTHNRAETKYSPNCTYLAINPNFSSFSCHVFAKLC